MSWLIDVFWLHDLAHSTTKTWRPLLLYQDFHLSQLRTRFEISGSRRAAEMRGKDPLGQPVRDSRSHFPVIN